MYISFSLATITLVCLSSPCITAQQLGAILAPKHNFSCITSLLQAEKSKWNRLATWNVWESSNPWIFNIIYNKESEVCGQNYKSCSTCGSKSAYINNFHFFSFLAHLKWILKGAKHIIKRYRSIILYTEELFRCWPIYSNNFPTTPL